MAAAADLAGDLALALDPVACARQAGYVPDAWQAEALRSSSRRLIFNTSRQAGKSLTAAMRGVHKSLYSPGSLTLIFSPSQRQSAELLKTCTRLYDALGHAIPADGRSKTALELRNKSRILSLPGDERTTRGFSPDRVIVDEAARCPDELFLSILPALAVTGGDLLLLSSPFGRRGFFFETWEGGERWERWEVPATECPRISQAELDEARRLMGEAWYLQEYFCAFNDASGAVFAYDDIAAMIDPNLKEWTL